MSDSQIFTLAGMTVVLVLFFGTLMVLYLRDEARKLDDARQQRDLQTRRDDFNRVRASLARRHPKHGRA